jgi:hypothetical protein
MGWPLAKLVKTFGVVQCVPKLLTSFATQAFVTEEAIDRFTVVAWVV